MNIIILIWILLISFIWFDSLDLTLLDDSPYLSPSLEFKWFDSISPFRLSRDHSWSPLLPIIRVIWFSTPSTPSDSLEIIRRLYFSPSPSSDMIVNSIRPFRLSRDHSWSPLFCPESYRDSYNKSLCDIQDYHSI